MTKYITPLLITLMVPLMGQEDCEPEPSWTPVVLTFVGSHTGQGLEGIPVWLGVDANAQVIFTDENGEAHFLVEHTVQPFSFGHEASGSMNIWSYDGWDLAEGFVFTISSLDVQPEPAPPISGAVNGHEEGDCCYVSIQSSDGKGQYEELPVGESFLYSFTPNNPAPAYLMAAVGEEPFGLPHRFDIVLDPAQSETLNLTRTLDQTIEINHTNVNTYMDQGYTTLDLEYEFRGISLSNGWQDAEEVIDQALPTFKPWSELEGLEIALTTQLVDSANGYYQAVHVHGVESGPLSIEMPDLHHTFVPAGLDMASAPGTVLQTELPEEADRLSARLTEYFLDQDGALLRQQLYVAHKYPGRFMELPQIPVASGLRWPMEAEEGSLESIAVFASTAANHNVYGDPSTQLPTSGHDFSDQIAPSYPTAKGRNMEHAALLEMDVETDLSMDPHTR